MAANLITIFRIALLVVIFVFLSRETVNGHIAAFILTIILIALDGVDGMVARRLHQESQLGSVLDIVVDRIVENCFWIFFAVKGVIPYWFPMIVAGRGFLVDGIRSVALARGMTAFGGKTLHKSKLGAFLVSSRFSRGLYGVAKVFSFLFLILLEAVEFDGVRSVFADGPRQLIIGIGYTTIYFSLFLCLLRGIPVLAESRSFLFPGRTP